MGSVPTIVYPAKGLDEVFDRHDNGCIERYLQGLWDLHHGIISPETEYMITMVWNEDANEMADVWTHRGSQTYGFGPLIDVKNFRKLEHYIPDQMKKPDEGCASGNTTKAISEEEEYRVALGGNLQKFLYGKRPKLPDRMTLGQDFYLIV